MQLTFKQNLRSLGVIFSILLSTFLLYEIQGKDGGNKSIFDLPFPTPLEFMEDGSVANEPPQDLGKSIFDVPFPRPPEFMEDGSVASEPPNDLGKSIFDVPFPRPPEFMEDGSVASEPPKEAFRSIFDVPYPRPPEFMEDGSVASPPPPEVGKSIFDVPFPRPPEFMEDGSVASEPPKELGKSIFDVPYPRPPEFMEDGSVASEPPTEAFRSIFDIPFPRPPEFMEDGSVASVPPKDILKSIFDIPFPRPPEFMEDGSIASVPPKNLLKSIFDIPFPRPPEFMEDGSIALVLPGVQDNETSGKDENVPFEKLMGSKRTKKTMVLGFLQFEEIQSLGIAQHLEKIFPKNWILPKFDTQSNRLIADAQEWIKKAKEVFGFQSSKKLLDVLESNGKSVLNISNLPIMIKEMLSSIFEQNQDHETKQNRLLHLLPDLDRMNFNTLSSIFNIPSELQWPVPRESLNLLIPVVVPLPENVLQGNIKENTLQIDMLRVHLPVTDTDGTVLFANVKSVFQGLPIPEKLNVKPIATFTQFQDEKIIPFWNMLKGPLLSKLALGNETSNTIMGPVMNLISLPKIMLSSFKEAVQATEIPDAILNSAKQLKSSFKSFTELIENSSDEKQEEIRDNIVQEFLNFSIPFVGVQKNILSTLLSPLDGDSSGTQQEGGFNKLIQDYPAIVSIYTKIEHLTTELKKSLETLRSLLPTAEIINIPDDQSVQLIINFSSRLIQLLDGMLNSIKYTSIEKALFPANSELTRFLNLFPKMTAPKHLKGRRLARSLLNPGALFSHLRSASPMIPLPLEQFRTLLSLTQNIARSPLNSDTIEKMFPEMLHLPISYAYITNRLPQELLSQPLSSLIADTNNIPHSLLSMNLGSFLDMANGLNNWVSSGIPTNNTEIVSRSIEDYPHIANLPDISKIVGVIAHGATLV